MHRDSLFIKQATPLPLLVVVSFLAGCHAIRRPPKPPEPQYMDVTDKFELLEVPRTEEPMPVFVKDGKPFCFTGTNNYYVIYNSRNMVDDVMNRAVQMNLDVFRIWGYIDRGSLDESVPSVDDKWEEKGSKNGCYFQYWDKEAGKVAVNEGENGLQKLDYVIHAARERGLKLIVVLTNNWQDFGGMDQYLVWFNKQYHHEFYTDETIRQAFKTWISTLVNRTNSVDGVRYKEDPAILAWELANEPKCRNHEEFDAVTGWDTKTMIPWVEEMSRFIKEQDPNHLVAVGDEGWLDNGGSHWSRQGFDGVDHEALCAVDAVDFCTFHLYPDDWGTGYKFGYDWIREHIDIARKLNKPTVLEEYGAKVRRDQKTQNVIWGWERRKTAFTNWTTLTKNLGGDGMIFWMLAGSDDEHGMYPDYDAYEIYQGEPSGALIQQFAADFKVNAPACTLAPSYLKDVKESPFVTVAKPEKK